MMVRMSIWGRSLRCLALTAPLVCALATATSAKERANPWERMRTPAPGKAQSVGGYSAGCVLGAERLPLDGKGYRVMRPSRRRVFGHSELVRFIRELGRSVDAEGLDKLLVGDLGQARGGPAPSGHASHQTGLDVDVWYRTLDEGEAATKEQREAAVPRSVVDLSQNRLNAEWSPRIARVLRMAASDAQVARVFVNPVIKQALCEAAGSERKERAYLSKIRPWYGHDEHFHVRLACPADSPLCEAQPPIEPGDGCAELSEWLAPEAEAERKRDRERYRARIGKAPELPAACRALLE